MNSLIVKKRNPLFIFLFAAFMINSCSDYQPEDASPSYQYNDLLVFPSRLKTIIIVPLKEFMTFLENQV